MLKTCGVWVEISCCLYASRFIRVQLGKSKKRAKNVGQLLIKKIWSHFYTPSLGVFHLFQHYISCFLWLVQILEFLLVYVHHHYQMKREGITRKTFVDNEKSEIIIKSSHWRTTNFYFYLSHCPIDHRVYTIFLWNLLCRNFHFT